MGALLLSLTMCLTLEGVDLQVTPKHPLVTAMDMQGRPTVQLSLADRWRLERELTERGFSREQVAAAIAPCPAPGGEPIAMLPR